jgi:hypothetical protein
MLEWALRSKSLLPKWDMIHKFMHKKTDFSTKGCGILFARITTPILPDWAWELSSTPNPFMLVVTFPSHFFHREL